MEELKLSGKFVVKTILFNFRVLQLQTVRSSLRMINVSRGGFHKKQEEKTYEAQMRTTMRTVNLSQGGKKQTKKTFEDCSIFVQFGIE